MQIILKRNNAKRLSYSRKICPTWHIYVSSVSFFLLKLPPLKQRRGRTDCGKAIAFALVSGFLPRRENKLNLETTAIGTTVRSRSVHIKSNSCSYVNTKRPPQAAIFMVFGTVSFYITRIKAYSDKSLP